MLWKAARLAAIAKSGKLAVLDSAEKQSRFKTAMLTAKATGKLWIGGHDTLTEGRFRWLTTNGLADVTGALVAAPTNWQPFQPNNLNNADAMEAFSDADFKWAMAPVSKIQAYAIEYHASNPNSNDSDGDGALDNEERVLGSNPLDPSSVPTFDLKLTTSENGSLTGSGTFSRGATTTLTATPNPGYIFSSWSGDALGTDNPLSITMDSDKTIGANFGPDLADSDGDGYSNYDEIVTYKSNPNNTASIPGDPDGDGFFVAALLEGTGLMDAAGGDTMIVDAEGVPLASGIAAGGYFTMSEAQVVAAVASKDYEQLLAAFVPLVNDDFTTGVRDNYIIDPIPGFHYFYQHLGTQPSALLGRSFYTFFGNSATLGSSTELALVKHSASITASNLSDNVSLFFDPYNDHALMLGTAGTGTYSSDAIGVFDVPVATIALLVVESVRTLAITAVNGSVNGGATYPNGAIATLTATPISGYVFSGWTGDASGAENPLSLMMDSDKTIGATFEQDLADSDGDSLSNYAEVVTHGTNPNLTDTDGDGLTDGHEVNTTQSNPKLADSNGDGLRDGLVAALGKNPMDDVSAFMSALMANRAELGLHKTEDITDMRAGSMMIERAAGTNKLQFRMKLQKSNDMHNWQDDGEAVFESPMGPSPSKQFYRFGVK